MLHFCNARESPTQEELHLLKGQWIQLKIESDSLSLFVGEKMGVPEKWQDFPGIKRHCDGERLVPGLPAFFPGLPRTPIPTHER